MKINKIVGFGALAPPLSEQIHGLPKVYDKHAKAIIHLYLHGILTECERHRACERLMKKIEKLEV